MWVYTYTWGLCDPLVAHRRTLVAITKEYMVTLNTRTSRRSVSGGQKVDMLREEGQGVVRKSLAQLHNDRLW